MNSFAQMIDGAIRQKQALVRVTVAEVKGSAPREAGAVMWVSNGEQQGTIGGGQLEYEAITHAREWLSEAGSTGWLRDLKSWPLGPRLGQCCGGHVQVLFERMGVDELALWQDLETEVGDGHVLLRPLESGAKPLLVRNRKQATKYPLDVARVVRQLMSGAAPATPVLLEGEQSGWFIETIMQQRKPFYLYGAGHIGRAIASMSSDLSFDLQWVDTHDERFPVSLPSHAEKHVASHPQTVALQAPAGSYHLVMTYSHQLDFEICRGLLKQNNFGFLGLIGSASKKARFLKGLREAGIVEAALARLTCPIGIDGIESKQPAAIALSTLAQLQQRLEREQAQSAAPQREGKSHA